jgi:raffinose/stachyose/melibiose transport system substrate-binding protein
MFKKISVLVIVVLVGLLTLSNMVYAEEGELVYWSMWEKGEPQQKVLEEAFNDFSEEFDVEVDLNWVGRDNLTTLKTRTLSEQNVDLVDKKAEEIYGALVANDMVKDLSNVLEMKVPNEDNTVGEVLIEESYNAYQKEDGTVHMLPYNFITSAFWYDKALFRDLSIEVPETWDEFLVMTEKMKENDLEPVAFGLQTGVYVGYFPYLTSVRILGEGALNRAAGDPSGKLFEDPAWERVGEVLYSFSKEGDNLLMENYESSVYPGPQMDWVMGIAGTFYCGSWIPIETKSAAGPDFEYGSFQFPTFEGGKGDPTAVESYPIGMSILKNSDNVELAEKFIAFFSQEKYAEKWVEVTKNMSPRKGVEPAPELQDAYQSLMKAEKTFRLYDGVQADYPTWYSNVFLPISRDVLSGNINGKEFAEQMRIQTIKHWKQN